MPASITRQLSGFALDIAEGLSRAQKQIPPSYFYDELGSKLFEAITLLPEYGLTRADERLLRSHAHEIVSSAGPVAVVTELGSGNGAKTRYILRALADKQSGFIYRPIDVSAAALAACEHELAEICEVQPVCGDWMGGLPEVARTRSRGDALLLLFLGSSIGNLERESIVPFLRDVRKHLRPGDFFLLGADLVKDVDDMMAAYDDPTGVTGAFNLNLLSRINSELGADFDLGSFEHEVRWDSTERRIEMHLRSSRDQAVYVEALDEVFTFCAGETIWTESSHKFTVGELDNYARASGFKPSAVWVDDEWPFAEALWQVTPLR